MPRRQRKASGDATVSAPAASKAAAQPKKKQKIQESQEILDKRQRVFGMLRGATSMPSAYAALKLVKEIGDIVNADLTNEEEELIRQASIAVPFLMYKRCAEDFKRPRTMGGLAYSDARAKEIALQIFEKMGPACCSANLSETTLRKVCDFLKPGDVHRLVPILKGVGEEARSEVDVNRGLLQGINEQQV